MLQKNVTKRKNSGYYNSRAWYRSMKYLEENNLIKKVPQEDRSYLPQLTLKGRVLAKILAGFTEVDPKVRALYGVQ